MNHIFDIRTEFSRVSRNGTHRTLGEIVQFQIQWNKRLILLVDRIVRGQGIQRARRHMYNSAAFV